MNENITETDPLTFFPLDVDLAAGAQELPVRLHSSETTPEDFESIFETNQYRLPMGMADSMIFTNDKLRLVSAMARQYCPNPTLTELLALFQIITEKQAGFRHELMTNDSQTEPTTEHHSWIELLFGFLILLFAIAGVVSGAQYLIAVLQ